APKMTRSIVHFPFGPRGSSFAPVDSRAWIAAMLVMFSPVVSLGRLADGDADTVAQHALLVWVPHSVKRNLDGAPDRPSILSGDEYVELVVSRPDDMPLVIGRSIDIESERSYPGWQIEPLILFLHGRAPCWISDMDDCGVVPHSRGDHRIVDVPRVCPFQVHWREGAHSLPDPIGSPSTAFTRVDCPGS